MLDDLRILFSRNITETIGVGVLLASIPVVWRWILQWHGIRVRRRDVQIARETSLEVKNLTSQKIIAERDLENSELKKEINELKLKLAKYIDREFLRSQFQIDECEGTFVRDGKHYCVPCFEENDPPIESPMILRDGWLQCVKCNRPAR